MANLPLILVVAAFILTMFAAFWQAPAAPFPRFFPHPGWLGLSLYFLSLLVR
jgi:hypothetical protein